MCWSRRNGDIDHDVDDDNDNRDDDDEMFDDYDNRLKATVRQVI